MQHKSYINSCLLFLFVFFIVVIAYFSNILDSQFFESADASPVETEADCVLFLCFPDVLHGERMAFRLF